VKELHWQLEQSNHISVEQAKESSEKILFLES
jgi:hypothetical protein